jgi:hypothetical protein
MNSMQEREYLGPCNETTSTGRLKVLNGVSAVL